ncbi:MAG TPA: hypothetical protein VF671_09870 [Pseudomonas sp.]|jgi:hypothetical protein|uniref:hypothetical protein n=1 Tax=Pseudomonas sp. TaxID=306 RepID=UPI002ED7884F
MKRLTRIVNPISVIAVFAALSEASATTVLPYLDDENRQIYIWFLIAFPSTLVVFFFLTLNFNNKVLYTPTELKNSVVEDENKPDATPSQSSTSKEAMALNLSFSKEEYSCRKSSCSPPQADKNQQT